MNSRGWCILDLVETSQRIITSFIVILQEALGIDRWPLLVNEEQIKEFWVLTTGPYGSIVTNKTRSFKARNGKLAKIVIEGIFQKGNGKKRGKKWNSSNEVQSLLNLYSFLDS